MRAIKLLADVAGQRVFADFGTFVLERLVRSAERRTGAGECAKHDNRGVDAFSRRRQRECGGEYQR
jgi:hypothetical protein